MSETKRTKQKSETKLVAHSVLAKNVEKFRLLPQKKLLLASCLLHVVFFSLLFINWHTQDPIKPIHIPENIQARVVSLAELKQLQTKKEQEQKIIQDQLDREKALAEQKRLKSKEKEQARKKENERIKAAQKKKVEAEKLLQIKKKKEEQAKRDKEKKLKDQEAKQKRALDEKRKADEAKKLAEERAKQLQSQETKMLEKLKNLEQQKMIAAQQAQALALENEKRQQEQNFLDYELTEKERYMARIKTQIEGLWRIPPKSEGLRITLGIRLLPNGELSSVKVIKSSGNDAFDRSAILAVKSVRRFLVPDDNKVFERNFRQFNMSFTPE